MRIYIEEPIRNFLEKALPKLQHFETIDCQCPICGRTMRFPVIARREDIETFEKLIKMAKEYIIESGAEEKMLDSILKKINSGLNLQ